MTPEQIAALKAFARTMIRVSWEGGSMDGGEIQDEAEKHGLIVTTECTEENMHIWQNIDGSEYLDLGDSFFTYAPWMKGAD